MNKETATSNKVSHDHHAGHGSGQFAYGVVGWLLIVVIT